MLTGLCMWNVCTLEKSSHDFCQHEHTPANGRLACPFALAIFKENGLQGVLATGAL
jgi:hypothetical protein